MRKMSATRELVMFARVWKKVFDGFLSPQKITATFDILWHQSLQTAERSM